MRPKVVILTLLVAFGLLGSIAVFKGMQEKRAKESDVQPPGPGASVVSNSGSTTNAGGAPVGGQPVAVSDELRAAVISKSIEQIQELQGEADGSNNPVIIAALLDKLAQPETEVRQAALQALKELNDTNAIPGLQKAVAAIPDPRGKVAVMDVIDYLNLPDAMPAVQPPETLTNGATSSGMVLPDDKVNQHFVHKARTNGIANGRPSAVSSLPANAAQ